MAKVKGLEGFEVYSSIGVERGQMILGIDPAESRGLPTVFVHPYTYITLTRPPKEALKFIIGSLERRAHGGLDELAARLGFDKEGTQND